jgi:hypothetical protein
VRRPGRRRNSVAVGGDPPGRAFGFRAALGGRELFRRVARQHEGTPDGDVLAELTHEVEEDRQSLRRIMARLDVTESAPHQALMWLGEKAGRLKPNGYVVARSPLSDVLELEALRGAVASKLWGWQALRAVSVRDERLDRVELESLIERADSQLERLYEIHMRFVQRHVDDIAASHRD